MCQDTHKACRPERQLRLPTRVLKINEDDVLLYLTRENDHFRYTTLSHCWGTSSFLTLNVNNYHDFQQSIPFLDLSKNFQDAITISRVLGYDYIWIDSLCIVQEDPQDWINEPGHMADIYNGPVLNIAATASPDGTQGCLFTRDPSPIKDFTIKVSHRGVLTTLACEDASLEDWNLTRSPLYGRVWCLQERLLAPRTLHFSKWQLFRDCNQAFAYEGHPTGAIHDDIENGRRKMKEDLGTNWSHIVKAYTAAQLTYSSDKAVALAGIARAYASRTGVRYVAGLWEKSLIEDLCWDVRREYAATRRSSAKAEVVFPSWSWLSLDRVVVKTHGRDASMSPPLIRIVSLDIVYNNPDVFGNVRQGLITIETPVYLRTSYKPGEVGRPLYGTAYSSELGQDVYIRLNIWEADLLELLLLPVAVFDDAQMHMYKVVRGLVLTRSGSEIGRYRRAGYFPIHIDTYIGHKGIDCDRRHCCVYCSLLKYLESRDRVRPVLNDGDVLSESVDGEGRTTYQIVLE